MTTAKQARRARKKANRQRHDGKMPERRRLKLRLIYARMQKESRRRHEIPKMEKLERLVLEERFEEFIELCQPHLTETELKVPHGG